MRSLLFVPGDSDRKLEKAPSAGADALLLDLEDSVSLDRKPAAREVTRAYLDSHRDRRDLPPLFVRINDLASGLAEDDLDAVVPARPDGIMLPKPRSGADVAALIDMLESRETSHGLTAPLRILAIATEVPSAVLAMHTFTGLGPRLEGLAWGSEDIATAIGATANRSAGGAYIGPLQLARNLCLYAASAAGVLAIDTVFTDFRDPSGLESEAREAARDGFTSKMAIHPDQVPVINDAFTPTEEEIALARDIEAAFATNPDAGVINLEGRMIDKPHLEKSRRILERARLAGDA